MGIIEFHFHDAEFDFSPSMTTGGDAEPDESDDEATDSETAEYGDWEGDEDESGGSGLGALVGLGVLVALGVLVGLKRRNSTTSDTEADESEAVELEA